MTDKEEILHAIEVSRITTKEAEARVSELVANGRQHVVLEVENMAREVKEQKGLLLWLKAWAQRLHK
jgi:hypothetical protein